MDFYHPTGIPCFPGWAADVEDRESTGTTQGASGADADPSGSASAPGAGIAPPTVERAEDHMCAVEEHPIWEAQIASCPENGLCTQCYLGS